MMSCQVENVAVTMEFIMPFQTRRRPAVTRE